jgi:hypothetical protein
VKLLKTESTELIKDQEKSVTIIGAIGNLFLKVISRIIFLFKKNK